MSYDIPPPLQHKEKIIFGLTFSQLAYALPTFLICFGLIFKSNLTLTTSTILALITCTLSAFFMFFNGLNHVKSFLIFIKNRNMKVNSDKLKRILNLKHIQDNEVHTTSNEFSVLEVTPLNLMIKTEEEQESIIRGFQKFLNSLDFPIQIYISTHPVHLDDHFQALKKKMENYPEYYDSYKHFLESNIKENNIKNRKFYIIIQKKYDLTIQTKVCEGKLQSIGLKVKKLKKDELINLLFSSIGHSKQKQLKPDEVVDNVLHFLVAPEELTFHPDCFSTKQQIFKILTVSGYPHSVEMGFLDKIISSGEDYDISLHIEPFPIETTMIQLNRELQKQRADLHTDTKIGIVNPSLEIKHQSTRKVLEDIQKGKQRLFNVSLYFICKATHETTEQIPG